MSFLAYGEPANPWFSVSYLRDNSDTILVALREHTLLTAVSVIIAAAVAIPLAVFAYRVRALAGAILGLSGVLYTIPSLALFALLRPVFGLSRTLVVVALVMFALLMIVRNTLTGLLQVPEEVRDAAQGMGYGAVSQLLRVELPLALPGIMTGVRLATVSTVALTTVGVLAGHGGLGQLILLGLRSFYKAEIATATLLCVLLALVLNLLLYGLERLLAPWARRRPA
jgi:osmoprotectant transport system permease protein